MANVQIKLFASLRELFDTPQLDIEIDKTVSVAELIQTICDTNNEFANLYASSAIHVAVNHTMVDMDALISPGDEIALFPPVTGG